MSGPDRIWAAEGVGIYGGNVWYAHDGLGGTEYIRRDPAVLAALPEVQAIVDAAVEITRAHAFVLGREAGENAEREAADRYRYVLEGVKAAIDTGRNEPLRIWRGQIVIALDDAAIGKRGEGEP